MGEKLPEHVRRNRAEWDVWAAEYAAPGERNWAAEPSWGVWSIPEAEVGMLPADLEGADTIELGCGTAYVSAWLARRGARPVGVDNSEAQLATARRLQAEHEIEFPLHHGNAERTDFADASFDFVVSEYGASIWCDPYEWIPEASRLLRPGGRLAFLVNSPIFMICAPDEEDAPAAERLVRPYFGMHRIEWSDTPAIEFHLPHGEMIDLLHRSGFELEALRELRPSESSTTTYPYFTLDWSRKWPGEEAWLARKPS